MCGKYAIDRSVWPSLLPMQAPTRSAQNPRPVPPPSRAPVNGSSASSSTAWSDIARSTTPPNQGKQAAVATTSESHESMLQNMTEEICKRVMEKLQGLIAELVTKAVGQILESAVSAPAANGAAPSAAATGPAPAMPSISNLIAQALASPLGKVAPNKQQ